jgi:purine-nucleoside phosphorylase
MPTPHISAEKGEFAPSILLPGDPLRARHIADNFLEDAREVTAVRNMLGYTGTYQGIPVSVMGTGMGIPSASIYVTELITEYGVERLIRVGSCGGVLPSVRIRDVILAIGACTDSGVNRVRYGGLDYAATADFGLLNAAFAAAEAKGTPVRVGNVHSADLFYTPDPEAFDRMERMGVLAVEMEAAGLYGAAAEKGARALTIVTVSDHVRTGEATTSEERQQTFDEMVEIALEAIRVDVAG